MSPQLGRKRYQTPSRDLDLGAVHHYKIRHIQCVLLVWAPISALSHCRGSGYLLGNNPMTRDGLVSDVGLFSPMVISRSSCHVARLSTSGILRPAPRY